MNAQLKFFAFVVMSCIIFTAVLATAQEKNKLEKWYTYWALGAAGISYPSELQDIMDNLKDMPGVDHMSLGIDFLGFYWPKGENTMIGGIINGFTDTYEAGSNEMAINGYLFGFSAMHFFQNRIGKGPFVRGDIGFARLVLDTNFTVDAESDWGFGALLGGGYGFPVSPETRVLIGATYSLLSVEGESYSCLQISIGGLF